MIGKGSEEMFSPEKIPVKGKVIDITVSISSFTPIFPGDPEPSIEKTLTLEKDGCAVSRLIFGSHTGTHVDAPSHVLKGGLPVDSLDIESLMGEAVVLDFSRRGGALTGSILEDVYSKRKVLESSSGVSILLLKTKAPFQKEEYSETLGFLAGKSDPRRELEASPESFAYLDASGAAWIVRNGFKTVGIDSFSVDSLSSESLPAHHTLLSSNVNIVECLDLSSVEAGMYFFLCLPLKIEGCDGAPSRALLISYS
ncbi:Metal-dependent hydrolase [Methanosarcina siciliae T4/M]|uniref:Metal-dependent hydrolase n=2 Tax=Methanosarcina siciliae TaxID=38027 RepID=A0A0E3LBG8_9EURY|nr:cyclase family protein [Methanosarcina siciliae]AKB29832.1 Metal-dependent hydrolase [Methanosarcina siciliae T4/M]AKB33746.1 Metal-dependent hydrolase [Methanosarcina siciliae HI350]